MGLFRGYPDVIGSGRVEKFQRRPQIVEAIQINVANAKQVVEWIVLHNGSAWTRIAVGDVVIPGRDGLQFAAPGAWVLRDEFGSFVVASATDFSATYERVA